MIAKRSLLLLLLLLTLVPLSAQSATAQRASEATLADMLPTEADLAIDLELMEEGGRSADEIAAGFPDSVEAAALLATWGFQENIYRSFAAEPGAATPNGTVYLEVSLHAMATATAAEQALSYYADGRIEMLGLEAFPLAGPTIGDQSAAVVGSTDAGVEATIYVRIANVLVRVTAVAPEGYPLLDATTVAYEVVAAADALMAPLVSLLPTESDVPSGLTMVADVERTLDEVAANYTDPSETVNRFSQWGWEGNVARTFEGSGNDDGIIRVYASIHRFRSADAAAEALDYSVADQAASTGATGRAVSSVGDRARGLVTTSAAGNEMTVYVQQGTVLIRVTVVSASKDPEPEALRLAELVARDVEGSKADSRESTATAEPMVEPTALPSESADCRGAAAWWSATEGRLIAADAALESAVRNLTGMTPDPVTVGEDGNRVAQLADDQWASAYPRAAQELNAVAVLYLQEVSRILVLLAHIEQTPTLNPPEYLPALTDQLNRLTLNLPIRRDEVFQAIETFKSTCGLP